MSTAYSNPSRREVGERVYGSSTSHDHKIFMNGIGILPEDFIHTLRNRFQYKHPNTYTLTKSIAEQIVVDYNEKFPVCIVRPSIVTASIAEPFEGWVDNVYGITGMKSILELHMKTFNF